MGNRLSKIYTCTGDDGTTGLGDGSRVGKDDARITAIGDIDEANSVLGVLLCEQLPANTSLCHPKSSLDDIEERRGLLSR